jgi:low affinity Fe/Cu permease
MSFRLFVYWCALCGGWAAALGWALGWQLVRNEAIAGTGLKGMFVGMLIALGLERFTNAWHMRIGLGTNLVYPQV